MKLLLVGFGVMLSDLLALAMMQSSAPSPLDDSIGAGQVASQHGKSTLSTPQRNDSRSDGTGHSSSTQDTKNDPQDQQINLGNDRAVATLQRPADEKSNPAEGSKTAKPEQPVVEETQSKHALHAYNEWVIKGAAPNKNIPSAARALPNKRLKDAFHVNNCFTEGALRCVEFRKQVEKVLQPGNDEKNWLDWPELVEVTKTVATLALSAPVVELNLFDAIHLTAMKTMLKVLFGKFFEGTSKDHLILKLAKGVNEQWIQSKKRVVPGETPEWEFERQGSLKAVAEEIFSGWDWGADNVNNPFNRILPGYETMWRVVLRSVLEITSTRHPASTTHAWKERLSSFIRNPTRDQLQNQKNDAGLTAEHLSFEVLRLYPPTRHVARMHTDKIGSERILTADMELLHHTAPVWGEDPLTYRPERWATLDGMEQPGYMPFGCAPFNCPAKQHRKIEIPFGVTMIAVLTGCFIEAMAGKWRLGEEGIPPISKPLCNGRKSYAEVSLYRLKSKAADITSNVVGRMEKAATVKNEAENTNADNATPDSTAAGSSVVADTDSGDADADKTKENKSGDGKIDNCKTGDDKTDDEAKMELSETKDSIGEDKKQTNAVQQ